jgi:serine/threonine-protein kinase
VIGRKVNNYEIVSLLGEGGMGSVYVAEHPVLGRKVAIKVLRREFAEDRTLVARFMNEARAASAIRQPSIIEILDVGTLPDGIPYLVMELLEGESLAGRLHRDKRLSVEDAVAITVQAATALGAAHGKQIVHRDLKPDNIFLVPDPDAPRGQRVVILDFGIAKLRGELSTGTVETHTGSVMGTPPYMSPEQCRGLSDEIDHRTDVYALGIILHEMLAGAPPFVSAGFGDLLIMHITQPPAALRSIDPTIPAHVEAAVLRALEKPRISRFPSMAELKRALVDPAGEAAATGPPSTLPPGARRSTLPDAAPTPRMVSTLSSTTGESVAVDPQAAFTTVPVQRSKRRLAAVVGVAAAGAAVAAALVARSGAAPSSGRPTTTATAPASALAPATVAPATTEPQFPTEPSIPTHTAPSRPHAVPAEPEATTVAAPFELERRDGARAAKHGGGGARSSRAKSHVADTTRDASAPAASAGPAPAPAPTAPAPASPPPARPAPKLSADKW